MDARTGLPVVGMVGAGQLARMTHQAVISLGQSLRILAETAEDGAAVVASDVVVGDYRSLVDLRAFARGCDVITFDHEHVPNEHLRTLVAEGVAVAPGPYALSFAQDKAAMRTRLSEFGIASPRWAIVTHADELAAFGDRVGWPLVLKAASGGYDGRGVWIAGSLADAAQILAELSSRRTTVLAEQLVPIKRELAAVVARSPFGQGAAWPIVETVQRDGICVEVIAPAPDLDDELADHGQELALRIAAELGVIGVLAVELFEVHEGSLRPERGPEGSSRPERGPEGSLRPEDGRGRTGCLVVNELAMRPHNSGHWTIEGARTSQFEQHVRAVLDYPLGSTELTAPVVVMANVLGGPDDVTPKGIDERVHHCMAQWPDVKIHLYGKGFRPGRKVGHVTALGTDLATVRERATAVADYLANGGPR